MIILKITGIIVIILVLGLIILGFIITICLGYSKKSDFLKAIDKKMSEIKSTDFDSLVSQIGTSYKEEEIVINGTPYKIRYFITRPGELEDFRTGYLGKKIKKFQEGESINSIEVVGSVDWYWLCFYFGHDFKEIISK